MKRTYIKPETDIHNVTLSKVIAVSGPTIWGDTDANPLDIKNGTVLSRRRGNKLWDDDEDEW